MEMSSNIKKYYEEINQNLELAYKVAEEAKNKGYDPIDHVEIPLAKNMAERVEGLISVVAPQIKNSGMVERIEQLEREYSKLDWRVALTVGLEVAKEKFCKFKDKREAMEVGIRVGLAYLTVGVVSSPLEGFTELKIRNRRDGREYFALKFSGPIRSAGTTVTFGAIVVADYIRKEMGYAEYDAEEIEIKRMIVECLDYHDRITNLQYLPDEQEVAFIVKQLPVQIDGEPSENLDVSNYKDLDRMDTNRIRNGVCLVIGEALCQKSQKAWSKINKFYRNFKLDHWIFLEDFIKLQKRLRARETEENSEEKIKPDYTYIKDLVAGRPILTHPLRIGGFRLRYGKSRISGLSSLSMHPATMRLLKDYIATGTQLRYERPGKSSAMAPCDSIDGPIIKLKDESVVFVENEEQAIEVKDNVEEILFLGDILINYGEFFNRGHVLVPAGYCQEWWLRELEKSAKEKFDTTKLEELSKFLDINKELLENLFRDFNTHVNFEDAVKVSDKLKIPLHPRWIYYFTAIEKEDFLLLLKWFQQKVVKDSKLILPLTEDIKQYLKKDPKRILELIGLQHKLVDSHVVIENDDAKAITFILDNLKKTDKRTTLEIINANSKIEIRDKAGTFIGARMGRPEKAKLRKLRGTPHVLFPVGEEGGKLRSFQSSLEKGKISGEFPTFYCENCNKTTIYPVCEKCEKNTEKKYYCNRCNQLLSSNECKKHGVCPAYNFQELPIDHYFKSALSKLDLYESPDLIKGIRGTSNEEHIPENLCKGILRAIHNLYVNKDGTMRYDMTEMPITTFKAKEIGTSLEKLKQLGYEKDINSKTIENDEQLIELKPSDVILPSSEESSEEGADTVLFRITKYIDDILKNFYGIGRFYNLNTKKDLIGHLIIGLAPHTSAAIVGRIIGFSKTQCCFAHPLWHSAQRRDCEGDETCVMLLMDALLNFSRRYLPAHRGATQDAPLVLTSTLIPSEVDDMVFDMEVVDAYPLELYEVALKYKWPWEIKIKQLNDRLGKESQYYDFKFTHPVSNLNMGVNYSAYKSIPTMQEKVLGQVELAEKIRAVDESDVARLVIERHFLRDIKGNLRKFSQQQFRCTNCNEKYRRPPLIGVCLKCGSNIIFTVSEGSIIKYLEPSISLAEKFKLTPYLRQSLDLVSSMIESVFGKEPEKQEGLGKWF